MINVGVIGYGYWGPNLVRNFYELEDSRVVSVCDVSRKRLSLVAKRYPNIEVTTDYRDIISDNRIDAVVVATPVSTHYPLALDVLKSKRHLFIEKPFTETSEQAVHLIEEADRSNLVVMVDHTFVYTGAVEKIKEMMDHNILGDIYYFDSVRVNLGLFQHDVNVIWDLAVHDLSIMDYIVPRFPTGVSATGISNIPGEPENVAYLTLFFDDDMLAHMHVNWLAPVKVRRTLIGGSRKMILYDDIEPSEKVKVYDKGIDVTNGPETIYEMLISYRTGDMQAPQLDITEALHKEAKHFIECIEQKQIPQTDGLTGLRIVRMLEAGTRSMKLKGKPESLSMDI